MSNIKSSSKRKELREKRRRQQRQQRFLIIGIVGIVVIIFAAIMVVMSIKGSNQTANITPFAPASRPNEQGQALGDPSAPVKIDVFEDFQCTSCQMYTQQIEVRIIDEYVKTGKVYYVFHQYPFLDSRSVLKESQQSANASMCAGEQGRFWDYHDLLYANWKGENQGVFNDQRLIAFAKYLKLNQDNFEACFKANRYKAKIEEDLQLGERMGVQGTPSVFVNGQIIRPGYIPQFEDIQQAVEAVLSPAQ